MEVSFQVRDCQKGEAFVKQLEKVQEQETPDEIRREN